MYNLQKISNFIFISLGRIFIGIPVTIYSVLSYPSRRLAQTNFEKGYLEYTNRLNDKNFFCYNNRENSKEFIESYIIPKLPESVEVIFLNGRAIESDYSREFISHALYRLKNYRKFPHLMKVRNGEITDFSLNNTFYSIINQNKPLDELLNEVDLFFDIDNKTK